MNVSFSNLSSYFFKIIPFEEQGKTKATTPVAMLLLCHFDLLLFRSASSHTDDLWFFFSVHPNCFGLVSISSICSLFFHFYAISVPFLSSQLMV